MRRTALLVACALALAACSPPTAQVTPSADVASASGRVTQPDAALTYPRPFQAARLVEARVLTEGEGRGIVVAARLESPLFADSPPRESPARLDPGRGNPVRLPLGSPVCPAPPGESTVVMTIEADGREVTETVVVDDSVLRDINADECAAQAVLDVAAPSFGAVETQTTEAIETTIVLKRGDTTPGAPVTLDAMTGNIVFAIDLDEAAERTLAAGAASLAVPAVVRVGRCDPHVFAESKKTWVFPVYLAVGDAEPAYVEIQPDDVTRAALQQLFDDCGEAERAD